MLNKYSIEVSLNNILDVYVNNIPIVHCKIHRFNFYNIIDFLCNAFVYTYNKNVYLKPNILHPYEVKLAIDFLA